MPQYIAKLNGLYFLWSTVVDAPVTGGMTLPEFREYYQDRFGTEGMRDLPQRMERVAAKGTSSRLDGSVDEMLVANRAGPGETCLDRQGVLSMLLTERKG